ncbi:hypothetical protein WR25_16140 [Diploscapter pachys]|uniref:Uncharacterized protein n=1 Tax=Diploscapter pachys TaxID=2018661 RepID=A0A2A2L951_9BILA|nr:hypothetical protein WR25_16140 [Diploscapter pachys]
MNMALSSNIFLLLLFIAPIFCAPESKIVDSKSKSEKSEEESIPPEHKSDKMPEEYMKYIEKIGNKCLTENDIESLYSNKSKFMIVEMISYRLITPIVAQIQFNEIRRIHSWEPKMLPLSSYSVNATGKQPDSEDKSMSPSEFFDKKIEYLAQTLILGVFFYPEDMEVADKVLNDKYPEIKQLYQLKMKDMKTTEAPMTNGKIDEMMKDSQLSEMTQKITEAVQKSIRESINDINRQKSRCDKKNI